MESVPQSVTVLQGFMIEDGAVLSEDLADGSARVGMMAWSNCEVGPHRVSLHQHLKMSRRPMGLQNQLTQINPRVDNQG